MSRESGTSAAARHSWLRARLSRPSPCDGSSTARWQRANPEAALSCRRPGRYSTYMAAMQH